MYYVLNFIELNNRQFRRLGTPGDTGKLPNQVVYRQEKYSV